MSQPISGQAAGTADPAADFHRFLKSFKAEAQLSKKDIHNFEHTTIDDVKTAIAEIQQRQVTAGQQKYLARLKPFLASLEQYGKVVEVFLNASEMLAFVWGPMKFMLQTASNYSEAWNLLLDAYLEFGELIPQLQAYQDHCLANDYMKTVLSLMYKDILEFHRVAMRHFRKQIWKQIFSALWKGSLVKLEELKDNMERHRRLIVEQASIVQFQETQKFRAMAEVKFSELQDDYLRRRWPAVQSWLSAYNSSLQQKACTAAKSECPGSGQWLLTDARFKKWFDPLNCSTPLLWLKGIPGAGKTVLVSTIVEEIQNLSPSNQISLAYFYCRHGDENRNSFVAVVKGLLSQLCIGNPDLVLHLYDKGNLQSGEATLHDKAMAEDLLEAAIIDPQKTTYVIIDGIDECDRDERKDICSWFIDRVNKLPKEDFGTLRCLFTSQEDGFAKKDFCAISAIEMNSTNTRNDIKRYVTYWQGKIEGKHGKLDPTGASSPLVDLIMSGTQGMFLYAKLVTLYLYGLPQREEFVDSVQPGHFPEGLDELYDRLLQRIFSDDPQSKARRNTARRLLSILTVAKRPIRWHEVQGLFAFDPDDETSEVDYNARKIKDDPKTLCWSLVDRQQDDSIDLVHPTARKYLIKHKHVELELAELHIAQLCLTYLSFPHCAADQSSQAIASRFLGGYYSFMDYAIACWSLHLQEAAPKLEDPDLKKRLGEELGVFLQLHRSKAAADITPSKLMVEKFKSFHGYDFYPQLIQALVAARKQLGRYGKGPSDSEPLDLNQVVILVREVYESIPPTSELRELYGDAWFKCPRMSCVAFYHGYATAKQRDQHVAKHERPYTCGDESCLGSSNFGYATERNLQRHLFEVHGIDPGRNVKFPAPAREARKQTGGSHRCPECSVTFTRGSTLRNHMRIHSGERPFVCKVCSKAFARQSDCARHEVTHSGNKKYVCGGMLGNGTTWGCGAGFSRQDNLKDHFRSNSGRRCVAPMLAELEGGVVAASSDAATPNIILAGAQPAWPLSDEFLDSLIANFEFDGEDENPEG